MTTPPLVLLGCGYTLERLALWEAPARPVHASTRDPERAARLTAAGVQVHADALALAQTRGAGAELVMSIPPEAGLDAAIADTLSREKPARLVYLSSTAVYGNAKGRVTEKTPVHAAGAGAGRVAAEALYRPLGAILLRIAGIYGPGRGLHERLKTGTYQLPGGGTGHVSRIHVDDLCDAITVALACGSPGEVYNVADDAPVPQREVVEWLCARLGVPVPGSIPLEEAPPMLRGDRQIQNAKLRGLGWWPRFPTYREGFSAVLAG